MNWRPKLSPARGAPIYRRLLEAIASDIAAGKLRAGARLPPQRQLAHALSVSVGAVTRAYDEATQRGLVQAHVGRGTFVVNRAPQGAVAAGEIDLSVNTAPAASADAVAATIASLRRAKSLQERLDYLPPWGLESDRKAGAEWLAATSGLEVDWAQVICCTGAQAAMAIAASTICRAGDAILCEEATFSGVKLLSAQLGYRLCGVEMDDEGVRPHALDRRAAETGARLLYCLPTLHNPTTRTASEARRAAIAKVARKRDLMIIEDDVYGAYARARGIAPLASFASERTFFVSSLSKTLSPGLRVGYLVPPAGDIFERAIAAIRALYHSPPGLGAMIATDWIASGRAGEMLEGVCAEVAWRTRTAMRALGPHVAPFSGAGSLHLWLPMGDLEAERLAGRALRAGLRLTTPQSHCVDYAAGPIGVRLCIGSAESRTSLERALSILSTCLNGSEAERQVEL